MQPDNIEAKYMSIREVTDILGVSPQVVYMWLKERRIEHLKIKARTRSTWLISRADFARFIKESKVEAIPKKQPGRPSLVNMEKTA